MAADLSFESKTSLPLQQIGPENHGSTVELTNEGDEGRNEGRNDPRNAGRTSSKKSLAFYLGFLGLNINALVFSLDATSLAVAIPVSFPPPRSNLVSYFDKRYI